MTGGCNLLVWGGKYSLEAALSADCHHSPHHPFQEQRCWVLGVRFQWRDPQPFNKPPESKSGPVLCFVQSLCSQQNVSGRVHGVPLIITLKNRLLPAHLLCFHSLHLTPSHVLGVSSGSRKGSGWGQPSLKHSFVGLSQALSAAFSLSWSWWA